jgi:hypothetical protein
MGGGCGAVPRSTSEFSPFLPPLFPNPDISRHPMSRPPDQTSPRGPPHLPRGVSISSRAPSRKTSQSQRWLSESPLTWEASHEPPFPSGRGQAVCSGLYLPGLSTSHRPEGEASTSGTVSTPIQWGTQHPEPIATEIPMNRQRERCLDFVHYCPSRHAASSPIGTAGHQGRMRSRQTVVFGWSRTGDLCKSDSLAIGPSEENRVPARSPANHRLRHSHPGRPRLPHARR